MILVVGCFLVAPAAGVCGQVHRLPEPIASAASPRLAVQLTRRAAS